MKLLKKLEILEEIFLVSVFMGAFLALFLQVISRYVFVYPLPWTEEFARFCFLWIVFFGSAYCMKTREHIAITVMVYKLPKTWGKYIAIVMHAMVLCFLLVVIWFGFLLSYKVMNLPTIAMGISSSWEYSAVPLACTLMAIRTALEIRKIILFGLVENQTETLM